MIGFVAFLIGHAAADLFWFSFIGYSVYVSKRFPNERDIKLIILCSALFLLFFGISYIHLACATR